MLSIDNHRRDSAGLRYIYPVISRRARGVSIGVNLNPNNACNWACIYCQVENLQRGGPPPLDIGLLESELDGFLHEIHEGDFMQRAVPPEAQRLMDVAFSGNGEPTSTAEFDQAVAVVCDVLARRALLPQLKVRVITNGSFLHRAGVAAGLSRIAAVGGEVWFKLDRVTSAETALINGVRQSPERVLHALGKCAKLVPTWLQTCWFAVDGLPPSREAEDAYCAFLARVATLVRGVHLYGLARPSLQPGAVRISLVSETQLLAFAERIEKTTGVKVIVSP